MCAQIIGASVTVTHILAASFRFGADSSFQVGHGMPVGTVRWWEQFMLDFVTMFPKSTVHNGAVSGMGSTHLSL